MQNNQDSSIDESLIIGNPIEGIAHEIYLIIDNSDSNFSDSDSNMVCVLTDTS